MASVCVWVLSTVRAVFEAHAYRVFSVGGMVRYMRALISAASEPRNYAQSIRISNTALYTHFPTPKYSS